MKTKKILAMLMAATMVLGMVSCGDSDSSADKKESTNESSVSSADDSGNTDSKEEDSSSDDSSDLYAKGIADSSESDDSSEIDLNDLRMQQDLVGKWECQEFIYGGKSYTKADLGVELYKQRFEFLNDNTGRSINPNNKEFPLHWSMENGKGFIVEDASSDKADLEFKDGVLTCVHADQTFIFKKVDKFTEDDSSSDSGAAKTVDPLKNSNSNAKLVFTTVNGTSADLIADGESSKVKAGKVGPIKASELDESDPLQKAVKDAMKENKSEDGYVCWLLEEKDSYSKITWAQWSEDKSGMIGQYPDPEKNAAATHDIGEKF